VFGSDHGLCGRFNVDIAGYVRRHIEEPALAHNDYRLLAVGAQAAARLGQDGYAIDLCLPLPGLAEQITGTVQRILMHVDAWREHDRCRTVRVFYNRRDGQSLHTPAEQKLLPLDRRDVQGFRNDPWPSRRLPIFTMDRTVLLSRLVRQYLFITLFRACAESQASEHASRVAAMQSAEGSIAEKLDDTMMSFRRARQRAITAELMDVITGYEASHAQGRGAFGPDGSDPVP